MEFFYRWKFCDEWIPMIAAANWRVSSFGRDHWNERISHLMFHLLLVWVTWIIWMDDFRAIRPKSEQLFKVLKVI